jgi:hypothetical protein
MLIKFFERLKEFFASGKISVLPKKIKILLCPQIRRSREEDFIQMRGYPNAKKVYHSYNTETLSSSQKTTCRTTMNIVPTK